jgi:predicted Zn-dependent protease
VTLLTACASSTKDPVSGTHRSQLLLVSADTVNQASLKYYAEQNAEARTKGELITSGAEFNRVARIMQNMIPQVGVFRADASKWNWELVLINEDVVNAHVMAGGKITFYTGLIRKLNLIDDEIAAVMGHEISHALREHTREKMSQQQAGNVLLAVGGAALGASAGAIQAAGMAKQIALDLPFSRGMESEADEFGLELAARAGYNPQAAVSLWDKMAKMGGGGGPKFMSTHPAPGDRQATLSALQPKVQPLYEAALKTRR